MAKHKVRVVIREITYSTIGQNILGQDTVIQKTAYGPGRPEIDPQAVVGPGGSLDTKEGKKAVEDFQKGELVELLDEDYIRLRNGGAVLDAADAEERFVQAREEVLDVLTASPEELARWIQVEKPSANAVVEASQGNSDLAQKLLEAESLARQPNEPRKAVVDGLAAVVARG